MIVSMAAPATATAIAASSSSSSTSLPLCNKLPHFLPSNYHSLSPFPTTHFTPITPKPLLKPLKLRAQFPRTPHFSLILRSLPTLGASAAFTGQPESETLSEKEERENDDDDDDDDDGKEQTETGGRLYVGNLPYTTTASELGDIFGEAGRVASVEIVYDRLTDRSRGFGFVTMGSVEEAKEAIRMFDGSQIGGRTVKVNFPEVPKGGEREVMGPRIRNSIQAFVDSPYKLYAGNLSWNITSQGLSEAFADQPGLLSAKVVYDRDSGRSRGFGFVSFSSAKEVESALSSMNGVEVEGRPLRLNKATERGTSSRQAINSENSFDDSEMLSSFSS